MHQMMIHAIGPEERLVVWDPEAGCPGHDAVDPRETPSSLWHKRGEIVAWIEDQGGGDRLEFLSGIGIWRDPRTGKDDLAEKTWAIERPFDDAFVAALKIRFW